MRGLGKAAVWATVWALGAAGCGAPPSTPVTTSSEGGILGGQPVTAVDPIAQSTALLLNASFGSFCTASVVNSRWLLTAAHCLAGQDFRKFVVIFSGTYADYRAGRVKSQDLRGISEVQIHPRYPQAMKQINEVIEAVRREGRDLTVADLQKIRDWGDLALIKVDNVVPAGKSPVRFYSDSKSSWGAEGLTVAGYGQRGVGPNSDAGELYKVVIKVLNARYSATEILGGNIGHGACYGDSGGPAFAYINRFPYLLGMVSYGIGSDSGCSASTVYTNVLKYLDWIQTTATAAP